MLGPSEGGLGGLDAPDRFSASGRNGDRSEASAFFADEFGCDTELKELETADGCTDSGR